jgi:hypothetical protein
MGAEDLARAADMVMDDEVLDFEQRRPRHDDVMVLDRLDGAVAHGATVSPLSTGFQHAIE